MVYAKIRGLIVAIVYCTESEYRTKICKLHQPIALLAFGNRLHTLEKLATTTQANMNEMHKAAEAKDMKALNGGVHHLRSSWMQIKAEQPLAMLYETVHKEDISDKDIQSVVKAVLTQGRLIVDLARKEAERWVE